MFVLNTGICLMVDLKEVGGGGRIVLFLADKETISIPLEIDRVFQIMTIVHQE